MQSRRVLLIESDEVGWPSVCRAVESLPDVRVVGSTGNRSEAAKLARTASPDAIVAAWQLEDASVIPLLRQLRPDLAHTTFILLADDYDPAELLALDEVGISSYLLWKTLHGPRLRTHLNAAIWGGAVVISNDVAAAHSAALRHHANPNDAPYIGDRELAVLRGLGEGLKQDAIAAELGVHIRTVESIIAGLKRKLGAFNEFTLCLQAMRAGLLV